MKEQKRTFIHWGCSSQATMLAAPKWASYNILTNIFSQSYWLQQDQTILFNKVHLTHQCTSTGHSNSSHNCRTITQGHVRGMALWHCNLGGHLWCQIPHQFQSQRLYFWLSSLLTCLGRRRRWPTCLCHSHPHRKPKWSSWLWLRPGPSLTITAIWRVN